ncbi:Uncharacterised protein [Corynebacterium kutscheri]|uniref:Uncharacterized protein n=1 Tax=Corynebacterium kutscheri TaxID=35755 RepID=A0A0F6TCS3_9CORY|nr:hypothetical protein [Corynebacterium kutscheri]AKE41104.1 hypothetical protein UL82_04600 [Corynebacterium kutscheri]VEH07011.1 Uncharacterised protein [Corynebacterium kutscheri]VEH09422.1 Uncharacterised protein [Corynebacterium kutscheri]VEH79507.1 Uncharacterised protein [Corynebacterium kutscheri]
MKLFTDYATPYELSLTARGDERTAELTRVGKLESRVDALQVRFDDERDARRIAEARAWEIIVCACGDAVDRAWFYTTAA